MGKDEHRVRLLAARSALPVDVRACGDAARDAALEPLLRAVAAAGGVVAAYASFGTEPSTAGLVDSGLLTAATLLPVVRTDRDLDWVPAGGGPALGSDALCGCDVVLVPALAVDRRGVRLGRGGGSYDRALGRATGLVVALLHDGELVAELPCGAHDVPVHAVALPSGVSVLARPAVGRRPGR